MNRPVYNMVCARILLLSGLLLCSSMALAQKVYSKVVITDGTTSQEQKGIVEVHGDLAEQARWMADLQRSYWQQGRYGAKYTNKRQSGDTLYLKLRKGRVYELSSLDLSNVDEGWRQALKRTFDLKGVRFDEVSVSSILSEVLDYAQNNGYPFAIIWVDSFQISGTDVSAVLRVDEGPQFAIHDLKFEPEIRTTQRFLMNYLGIKPGELFDQQKIDQIESSISSLPYLSLKGKPWVSFSDEGKARIWLDLQNEQVSSFDGVVGVAPPSDANERTLFTGQLDFRLRNPLARGTSFDFEFEQFQQNSQQLDLQFEYPFILATSLGINFGFDLEKIDTLYTSLNYQLGLSYYFSGRSKMDFFYHRFRSFPLSDVANSDLFKNLESFQYGVGYTTNTLDYRPNPLRGMQFLVNGSAGRKSEIEDDVKSINSGVYRFNYDLAYYLALSNKFTAQLRTVGTVNIDSTFSQNQVVWRGGLKSVRGFNESSIPSKNYWQQTLEVRFLTDKDSHAKVFGDYAIVNQVGVNGEATVDDLIGLGVGYNFKTGPGIFTINYAVGSTDFSSIGLTNGKVHFGFVSYF